MKTNKLPSVSLIITTYNWPEALDLVLKSVENQSKLPDEVIIADDGSKSDTKELVEKYQTNFPTTIKHVWHEDIGFTRTKILNKAFKSVESDYIIQVDGDVILHKHFIKDHIENAKANMYLFGCRVLLLEDYSKKIFKSKKVKFNWFNKGIRGKSRGRGIYFPLLSKLNKPSAEISRKLRGCNMSYWKDDAFNVNGYDENLVGWGFEDSNFAVRLLNSGVISQRLKNVAILYHIYHPEDNSKGSNNAIGNKVQDETREKKIIKCINGIENLND